MYEDFYRLTADPFRLSPDHSFCFRYPSFTKAKAYMRYALNAAEGFVMVTGRPGMGKTTLISDLLSDLAGADDYLTGMLVNTQLEATALLRMVAYEFGLNVQPDEDKATVLRKLNLFFIQVSQSKRRPLLVVDEAQNLKLEALEELRLLTNLQFEGRPLLQIFMVGQEELRDKIQDSRLEQLRQRITAACHLDPLTLEQATAYILHRLRVVGWKATPQITASTFQVIQEISQGVPRRINQFCSRLLLHGALEQKYRLGPEDARLVVEELTEEHLSPVSSNHDFPAGAEPKIDDESLLRNAEELLRQQEHGNRNPRPVRPAAAGTPSPGNRETRKPTQSRPVIPTLAEPQVVEPAAARSQATAQDRPESVARKAVRQSRWPIAAYTTVILLVMAIPFLALPDAYLEKWFPGGIRTILPTLSLARSSPETRPGDSTATRGAAPARTNVEPQRPAPTITKADVPAPAPIHEYPTRTGPDFETEPQPPATAKPNPQTVQPTAVEKQMETATVTVPPEGLSAEDLPRTSDQPVEPSPAPSLVREISFGFDSTEIRSQDRLRLDEVANSMKASDRWMAKIVGYTDSVGSRRYNQRLSQLRANVVAAYLTRQGVPADRLHIEGRGSSESLPQHNGDASLPRTKRLVRILLEPR